MLLVRDGASCQFHTIDCTPTSSEMQAFKLRTETSQMAHLLFSPEDPASLFSKENFRLQFLWARNSFPFCFGPFKKTPENHHWFLAMSLGYRDLMILSVSHWGNSADWRSSVELYFWEILPFSDFLIFISLWWLCCAVVAGWEFQQLTNETDEKFPTRTLKPVAS